MNSRTILSPIDGKSKAIVSLILGENVLQLVDGDAFEHRTTTSSVASAGRDVAHGKFPDTPIKFPVPILREFVANLLI